MKPCLSLREVDRYLSSSNEYLLQSKSVAISYLQKEFTFYLKNEFSCSLKVFYILVTGLSQFLGTQWAFYIQNVL